MVRQNHPCKDGLYLKALGELAHRECRVAKQANLTSNALADLLADEEITRQVTLQNRAVIDYLLLLHGHQCEEFEGLCCFSLSSKVENIHKTIQRMKDMVGKIKRETDDRLSRLVKDWGLSGWVGSILKTSLLILFIIDIALISCGVIKKMIHKLMVNITRSPPVNHATIPSASEEDIELEEGLSIEGQHHEAGPPSKSGLPNAIQVQSTFYLQPNSLNFKIEKGSRCGVGFVLFYVSIPYSPSSGVCLSSWAFPWS
ncbi:hypothetical protein DUI87_26282 [Hirundo rustica rustica]|uniref:Uncharacterized protein n=1 Tax=Hirundo rustica rustica TaxID=333673 RepID=A0A3M0JE63_HIRRU|nr:hypothetical protein DUI87_26282 [Hirundo rustica rustica]